MHLFPCPVCGPRDETEFHYGGELGNRRPQPAEHVDAARWSAYLFERDNVKGPKREIWSHDGGCGLHFGLERNTATHEVVRSFRLDGPRGSRR
jgi:sarcosine oxidase subunit delta